MKIAALAHFAFPWRCAGSESVLHVMLKAIIDAGHEVKVWVTDCPGQTRTVFEGVELIPVRNVMVGVTEARRWKPDVMISHHQNAAISTRFARGMGARSVYLTHNDMDINMIPLRFQPDLVVHNSEWVRESLQRYDIRGQQMVIHPPLDCDRHKVEVPLERRHHVTLINVNEHKGGKILFGLAARMPDVNFMGVIGGHGVQVKPPRGLENLTMVDHGPDLRKVWSTTRLLIMPSVYESYGLVGIEAGCSGIPTLANETPGLRESLGSAAQFVRWPREHLPVYETTGRNSEWLTEWASPSEDHLVEWESRIRQICADDHHVEYSAAAAANSITKCGASGYDMERFVSTIEALPETAPAVPSRATRRNVKVT